MAIPEEASALLDVDRVVHEPTRLVLLSILYAVQSADFTYLANETGLTKGNLSSHLLRLEQANYIVLNKTYRGKIPLTICQITPEGSSAFESYLKTVGQFLETLEK